MTMYKEDDTVICKNYDASKLGDVITYHEPDGYALGSGLNNNSIQIYAENIQLHHKDLGITIDISNNILSQAESLNINGFKFIKEK